MKHSGIRSIVRRKSRGRRDVDVGFFYDNTREGTPMWHLFSVISLGCEKLSDPKTGWQLRCGAESRPMRLSPSILEMRSLR